MSGITYTPLYPTSRDEALSMVKSHFPSIAAFGLTLLNAGTGIGKTKMLRAMADDWSETHVSKAVTYLIAPNQMIGDQLLKKEFSSGYTILHVRDYVKKNCDVLKKTLLRDIEAGQRVLVYADSIGHSCGEFTKVTGDLCTLMRLLRARGMYQQALIDELDSVITQLTGGINPNIYHSAENLKTYGGIRLQTSHDYSLNVLDIFREAGTHVVGCSATLNNLICSKLSTLGYTPSEIQIWNVFPIKELYKNLLIKGIDTSDFSKIDSYLKKAEESDGKILQVFPTHKDIVKFEEEYQRVRKHPISALSIIAGTDHSKTSERLAIAKYVSGVKLVCTGFDINTHDADSEFILGVLHRKFSDKASQPLSINPDHLLHVEHSALMKQVLGRLRNGGIFLIPGDFNEISLYDLHLQVSEVIHRGHTQFEKFCVSPETLQPARYHQGLMLALIHGLRKGDDLPTVDKILGDLAVLAPGRNFKRESSNPATFEPLFWTRVFGICWERYYEEHDRKTRGTELLPSHSAKTMSDVDLILTGRDYRDRIMVHSGRGYREGREIEERVKEEVFARACGRCIHCSLPVSLEDRQIAHIKRHTSGGPASLSNLGMSHKGCDAPFDAGDLIHDPSGDYWRHPRINYRPDRRQLRFINPEYIRARWEEHKQLRGKTEDDSVFRMWLSANGYTRYRWA